MTISGFDLMAYISLGFNAVEVLFAGALKGCDFIKNRMCCAYHCVKYEDEFGVDSVTETTFILGIVLRKMFTLSS